MIHLVVICGGLIAGSVPAPQGCFPDAFSYHRQLERGAVMPNGRTCGKAQNLIVSCQWLKPGEKPRAR